MAELCEENVEGWYCTKPHNHEGDHIATIGPYRPFDFSQRIKASRPRDTAPVEQSDGIDQMDAARRVK